MLCRVADVLRSSLCRFSSASFAFFAQSSSLRACIVPATHAHIGREGVTGLGQSHRAVLRERSDFGGEVLVVSQPDIRGADCAVWESCLLLDGTPFSLIIVASFTATAYF